MLRIQVVELKYKRTFSYCWTQDSGALAAYRSEGRFEFSHELTFEVF